MSLSILEIGERTVNCQTIVDNGSITYRVRIGERLVWEVIVVRGFPNSLRTASKAAIEQHDMMVKAMVAMKSKEGV